MKFRSVMPLIMASLLLAPSASALSCAPPDIIRDLNKAKDSESLYYIFVGTFTVPKAERTPRRPRYTAEQSANGDLNRLKYLNAGAQSLRASFTGYAVTNSPRTDVALSGSPVMIKTTCVASWCGNAPSADKEIIAFVEVAQNGTPILTMGACGGLAHDYTPAKLAQVRQCLGQDCAPSQTW